MSELKVDVELDTDKSAAKNASLLFDKAKKLEKKAKKALDVLKDLEDKKRNIKEITLEEEDVLKVKKERKWFEKFRWFYSSTNKLVLGGRDATSNEVLLKKYTEDDELCFHADIVGAPFFVIKGESDTQSIKEAAQAAGSFSKAWPQGLGVISVYYVKRSQLSKKAPSGEYVSKGAFMVYGERKWEKIELKSAVGVRDGLVSGGPPSAIEQWATKALIIGPGDKKPGEIVKRASKILGVHPNEIQRSIPAGKSKFIGKIEK